MRHDWVRDRKRSGLPMHPRQLQLLSTSWSLSESGLCKVTAAEARQLKPELQKHKAMCWQCCMPKKIQKVLQKNKQVAYSKFGLRWEPIRTIRIQDRNKNMATRNVIKFWVDPESIHLATIKNHGNNSWNKLERSANFDASKTYISTEWHWYKWSLAHNPRHHGPWTEVVDYMIISVACLVSWPKSKICLAFICLKCLNNLNNGQHLLKLLGSLWAFAAAYLWDF